MAAFFGQRQGGVINVLKLTKLLYLSDRESLGRFGHPISYDSMVSLDNGPVLSRTLNLTNGFVGGAEGAKWDEWITDRSNHDVRVKRTFTREELNELSDADLDVLETVWRQFGGMDQWTLSGWTHTNCPEWKDPHGSSLPIDEEALLRHLGVPPEAARALALKIISERKLDRLFSRLERPAHAARSS